MNPMKSSTVRDPNMRSGLRQFKHQVTEVFDPNRDRLANIISIIRRIEWSGTAGCLELSLSSHHGFRLALTIIRIGRHWRHSRDVRWISVA